MAMINPAQEIPRQIAEQLSALLQALNDILAAELVGVYVHGSLAMGCFNSATSDVDLLVVVREKLTIAGKQQVAKSLVLISDEWPQNGIELSIVTLEAAQHFQYPTPYELHFSEAWKVRYAANAVDFDEERFDPDLAAHFTITIHRGLCLYGRPISNVFGAVPENDYRASILNDAQDILANIGKNPVYGVLNLCRVLAFLSDRQIVSKAEGGAWALSHVKYTSIVKRALDAYRNPSATQPAWDQTELDDFASDMRRLILPNIVMRPALPPPLVSLPPRRAHSHQSA